MPAFPVIVQLHLNIEIQLYHWQQHSYPNDHIQDVCYDLYPEDIPFHTIVFHKITNQCVSQDC